MEKIEHNGSVVQEEATEYKNSLLPVDDRVADLVQRMTLEEKISQMMCIWGQKKTLLFTKKGELIAENLKKYFADGMGQIARLSDTGIGLTAVQMAETANRLQKFFVEETRLGIPVIFHEECLHGLAGKEATSYPQPIGLGATFNPKLVEAIYTAIAEDVRMRGAHQALTPVVDVARDPRWGRVEETFGEDPFLVASMGVAAVNGFQGTGDLKDPKRVIATLKHFAAHGQPESGMNCAPVNVSERLLRDVFLYPFKEAITKGNALSVMASYNEIDGVPSHASTWLLRDVLRNEWGFKGFIVSDYYAVTELHRRDDASSHSVAQDKADAALLAVRAGVNIETPDPDCYPNIVNLVRTGRLQKSAIDELVSSLLKYKFQLGLFDHPYVDPSLIDVDRKLESDRTLAKQAALETITLLKNNGDLLPINIKKNGTIAVIGPNADRLLLGGYSGTPKYYTPVLKGIQEKVGNASTVLYGEGCKLTVGGSWNDDAVTVADPEENKKLIADAVAIAKKSDTVILVVGGNEQTSREAWSRIHMGDRASLDLFGQQNDLVKAIVETGKPVVVVLFNGRPNSINYIAEHVPAIVECWYLGQETGVAVADVLFGDYNPSGKLPISIPRSAGHLPSYYNYKPSARRGYLADDTSPLYPFGFGLSYTKFSFSNLRLERNVMHADESIQVFVDIENTGRKEGEEVVQMYIHDLVSSVTRPVKELKGFQKVRLAPNQKITVSFQIAFEHLAFTTINKENTVEAGEFEIMVGNSSSDNDLHKVLLTVKD
jgi:beta-glucosidase